MLNFGRILNKAIFSPAWPRCAEMRLSHVALSHRSSPQRIFQGMVISGHNRINNPVRCCSTIQADLIPVRIEVLDRHLK